jgi:hypothetical protein
LPTKTNEPSGLARTSSMPSTSDCVASAEVRTTVQTFEPRRGVGRIAEDAERHPPAATGMPE